MTLLKYAKRYVCEKGNIRGRERGFLKILYRGTKKTSDNTGGKPTRGFSIQHKTFSALNHGKTLERQWRNRLKDWLHQEP